MQCRECDLPIQWRCHDCFGVADLCTGCCVRIHQYLPFHRISQWTGDCFVRSSLRHTGLTLFLGHKGSPCGRSSGNENSVSSSAHTPAPDRATSSLAPSADTGCQGETHILVDPHVPSQPSPSTPADVDSSLSHSLTDSLTLAPLPSVLSSSQLQSPDATAHVTDSFLAQRSFADENTTSNPSDSSSTTAHRNAEPEIVGTSTLKGETPRGFDVNGNPWLTIVDITGVHHLPMHSCTCTHPSEPTFVQLLRLSLYPCTTERPRTVFTFRLLEDFDLENLETKASAQSFYSKLRRITNNVSPQSVPDRYRELMRVLREWRNLMSLKRMGYGHPPLAGMSPPEGGLAVFCAACPQPDINLPSDWIENASE